jgi:hypothetical protein
MLIVVKGITHFLLLCGVMLSVVMLSFRDAL